MPIKRRYPILVFLFINAIIPNQLLATQDLVLDSVIKDQPYLLPFVWATDIQDEEEYTNIVNESLPHPLTVGRTAFSYLLLGQYFDRKDLIEKGKKILNYLDRYPHQHKANNSIVYLYPDDYRELKGGTWWSGMANSAVALAYLKGYEVFGDEVYLDKAKQCIQGVINPVSENGCALKLSEDASWYLEYAAKNRTAENSYFVHNGFLFSVLALRHFAEVTNEEKYLKAYQKGINAMHLRESHYYFSDKCWTYYMSNPKLIESAHYMVYELILMEAIQHFEQDDLLKKYIDSRKEIAIQEYPIFTLRDNEVWFSGIGSPHPYWPDLYPTIVKLTYEDEETKSSSMIPRAMSIPAQNRFFICIEPDKKVAKAELYQVYNGWTYHLYECSPGTIKSSPNTFIAANTSTDHQAEESSHYVFNLNCDSDENRALIKFNFHEAINLYEHRFFGFVLNSEIDISNIWIMLIGEDGEQADRYYIPQPANENNLILLKGISFNNYERMDNKKISQIQLNLYYPSFEGKDKTLKLSNFFYYNDPLLTKEILTGKFGDVHFEEKTIPGNIY